MKLKYRANHGYTAKGARPQAIVAVLGLFWLLFFSVFFFFEESVCKLQQEKTGVHMLHQKYENVPVFHDNSFFSVIVFGMWVAQKKYACNAFFICGLHLPHGRQQTWRHK